jgi:hypothetical protein
MAVELAGTAFQSAGTDHLKEVDYINLRVLD